MVFQEGRKQISRGRPGPFWLPACLPLHTEKKTNRKFSISHNLAFLLMKFSITEVKYYFASPQSLLLIADIRKIILTPVTALKGQ